MVNDEKNNALGGGKHEKSNGEQSDFCDHEQVTLKPQFQTDHCLTTWLEIWYHSNRKGTYLVKQNCLFGVHPAVMGKFTFFFFFILEVECILRHQCSSFVTLLVFNLEFSKREFTRNSKVNIQSMNDFRCFWDKKLVLLFTVGAL